jgi:hypothetical protein
MTQTIMQLLINLYIFTNRTQSSVIKTVINKQVKEQTLHLTINLDRRVTVTPDLMTRTFDRESGIRSIGNLVEHIINW